MIALAFIGFLTNRNGVAVQLLKGTAAVPSILSQAFQTNEARETEGVWFSYGEVEPAKKGEGGEVIEPAKLLRVKLARMSRSNKRYTKSLDRATKPIRRQIQLDTLPETQARSVEMQVFVESVLLDWENMPASEVTGNDADTGYIPFTQANGIKLLTRLPEFYADLVDKASAAGAYRDEAQEAEAGN